MAWLEVGSERRGLVEMAEVGNSWLDLSADLIYTFNRPTYLSYSDDGGEESESLDAYFSRIGVPIIDLYEVPSIYTKDKLKYSFVPDIHKDLFITMIEFLDKLHEHGKSLFGLDESNLVVQGGILKFRGLEFVEMSSKEHRKHDYQLIHGIIMSLFQKHNPHNHDIPHDFQDFLRDLRNCGGAFSYEMFFSLHLALLPHHDRLELIKNFHADSKYIIDDSDRDNFYTALEKMRRSEIHSRDWTQRFKGSDPQVGAAKDCFEFEYSLYNRKEKRYRGTGSPRMVNGDILRFCRNMAVHLDEHIPKHTERGYTFSKMDVDLTIMALFGHELLSFQRLAHKYGVLKYFIPGQDYGGRQDDTSSSTGQRQASNSAGRSSKTKPS